MDRPTPPTLGLAAVADLWLWGALLLIAPSYLAIGSGWDVPFYVLGFGMLVISFAGALIELGRLLKSEGLNYWGVSLVFLLPAAVLFVLVQQHSLAGTLEIVARIGALILAGLGGAIFFQGVPYLFWEREGDRRGPDTELGDGASSGRRTSWKVAANAVVALLSLVTAVVTLAEKFLR